ncbi:MAG: 3-oxoacyl-ACP synthase III [Deltaproteobacteria bacterium]|nr:3-oxoacyl-ACP synthase III [Deltaproteobacteria bacterium]
MEFQEVSIIGLAHVDAPHRITSAELENQLLPIINRIHAQPDMIQSLTGIVARRFWEPGRRPSEVATMAAEKAISDAGIDRSRIGILLNTSVSRDYIEPSVACLVHGNLGLSPECMNFDVGNACLAFLNGMEIVGNMIERGQVDYGIVVDGEGSRFVVETTIQRLLASACDAETFRANFATFTLGSGGAALVLARSDIAPNGHRLRGTVSLAATQHSDLCHGQLDGMQTDAGALMVAGLALANTTFEKAKKELGWHPDDLDQFILHQVSAVHTAKLIALLGLDDSKVFKTFPEYGNVGPAAIPITLSKALAEGRIQKGDRVALMGIGSGLNCTMMEVRW